MSAARASTRAGTGAGLGLRAAALFGLLFLNLPLVFILLYALYWSNGFSLFQNVIVTIVSLAITGLLIGLMWIVWYRLSGELRRPKKEASDQ